MEHEQLLEAIRSRTGDNTKFGYGVTFADRYVKNWLTCGGDDKCRKFYEDHFSVPINWELLVKEAANTLTYCSEESKIGEHRTSVGSFKDLTKKELPPKTIMVVQLTVTTPHKDRDGDILRSEGAEMDPNQPFLWSHLHVMPIGKMIEVVRQDKKGVVVNSAIIDSPLGNDAAQLIEFGGLRISHGFLPKEWEKLDNEKDDNQPFDGFDFKRFEVMEHSGVTVPSNVEGVIHAFSRDKFASGPVKSWAKSLYDSRDTKNQVPGVDLETVSGQREVVVNVHVNGEGKSSNGDGDVTKDCGCKTGANRYDVRNLEFCKAALLLSTRSDATEENLRSASQTLSEAADGLALAEEDRMVDEVLLGAGD